MSKENLKALSVEQLEKKAKSLNMIIGIFIPILIGLFYFILRDYFKGEEMNWAVLTSAICTLGGPAVLYPELQEVQKELKSRE